MAQPLSLWHELPVAGPFQIVPEWAPQSVVWVGWPRLEAEWRGLFSEARAEIVDFVRVLSEFVTVRMAIGDETAMAVAISAGLDDVADLQLLPVGDIWVRDTGPLFALSDDTLSGLCFAFNGWGGKFDMPGDRETASAIVDLENADRHRDSFVLEGGAIDLDGKGRLLTTEECLLNPNRNGAMSREAVEAKLRSSLGVTDIIWLKQGLRNDHTDGHIDNVARFVGPGHVVCQSPITPDDPHKERLFEIETGLRASGLMVSTIPSPGRVLDHEGLVLPASHMNFLITNGAVLLPVYDEDNGAEAVRALMPLFPGRKIVPLPAWALCAGGGGAFHCMTRDVPAVEKEQ